LRQDDAVEAETPETDRDLIEQQVQRVIVKPQLIEVELVSQHIADPTGEGPSAPLPETGPWPVLRVPWTGLNGTTVKGIVHPPSADKETIVPANRDGLLSAIAKARAWVEELVHGRAASFAEIAEREGKAERYIRFLAPLAFVSPRIVRSIAEGSFRADLKVTKLVKMIACSWTEQERCLLDRSLI
jgi:hypothetical protein